MTRLILSLASVAEFQLTCLILPGGKSSEDRFSYEEAHIVYHMTHTNYTHTKTHSILSPKTENSKKLL